MKKGLLIYYVNSSALKNEFRALGQNRSIEQGVKTIVTKFKTSGNDSSALAATNVAPVSWPSGI